MDGACRLPAGSERFSTALPSTRFRVCLELPPDARSRSRRTSTVRTPLPVISPTQPRVSTRSNQVPRELQQVERIFVFLQVLTACFVAFSHGSNDVANAIGPLSAAYQAIRSGEVALSAPVPPWALMLGGVGIIAGLATWGGGLYGRSENGSRN
jgi:phosphate/sulfate permease